MLLEINNAVASHLDLTELMQAIFTCLRRVFPYDVVGLGIYDAEINQLRSYANVVPDIPVFLEEGEPIPLERTIPGLVFTSGKPVLLDRFDDPRFSSSFSKKFFDAGFRSGGSVPLIVHDRTLGTLGVGAKSETHLSQDEVELLCQVANQIAIAVENALNYERARKAELAVSRQFERERLMLEINNAVVSILDLGDLVKPFLQFSATSCRTMQRGSRSSNRTRIICANTLTLLTKISMLFEKAKRSRWKERRPDKFSSRANHS